MRLERQRSLQTDEMATNGARVRTRIGPSHIAKGPKLSPKGAHNLHERVLLGCLKADTLARAHVLIMGRLGA